MKGLAQICAGVSPEVTDEMVRQFRIAYVEATMHHPKGGEPIEHAVRAGLKAALNPQPPARRALTAAKAEELTRRST